jgi:TRAP-type C4-dicarboxylate transport system permease small subunit
MTLRHQPRDKHLAAADLAGGQPTVATRVLRVQLGLVRLGNWVETAIFFVSCALLCFLVVALFLQVLFRYVIRSPLPWTEEGARFALVWFAMLAASLAARKGQQFIFRWATMPLSGAIRVWLRQAVNLLTMAFLTIIFVQSLNYISLVSNQIAPATHINMSIPYAGIAAGIGLLIVVYFLDTVDVLCSVITKEAFSLREGQELAMLGLLARGEAADADLNTEDVAAR